MPELTVRLTPEDLEQLAECVAAHLAGAPTAAATEPWVDVAAAAMHLACKPQRIYDLVSAGAIPHRKEGRRVLFRLSELDRWLAAPDRAE